MNERIKLLVEEANVRPLYSPAYSPRYIFEEDELEKFVELLVKECAKFADDKAPRDPWAVGVKMIHHFGVDNK